MHNNNNRDILGFSHSLTDKNMLLWAYCLTPGEEIAAYYYLEC